MLKTLENNKKERMEILFFISRLTKLSIYDTIVS